MGLLALILGMLLPLTAAAVPFPYSNSSNLQGAGEFLEAGVDSVADIANPNDVDEDGTLLEDSSDVLDCNSGRCFFLGNTGIVYTYDDHDSGGVGVFWRRGDEVVMKRVWLGPSAAWNTASGTSTCVDWEQTFSPTGVGACSGHVRQVFLTEDWYVTRAVGVATTSFTGTESCQLVISTDNGGTPAVAATLEFPPSAANMTTGTVTQDAVGAFWTAGSDFALRIGDGTYPPDTVGPAACPASGVGMGFYLMGVRLGE